MYSSEYTSGFPGPAVSHLAAPLRLVTKAIPDRLLGIFYKWTSSRRSGDIAPFLPARLSTGHETIQSSACRRKGSCYENEAVPALSCFRHGTRGPDDPTRDRRNRNRPADGTRDHDGHKYRRRSSDNRRDSHTAFPESFRVESTDRSRVAPRETYTTANSVLLPNMTNSILFIDCLAVCIATAPRTSPEPVCT